MQCATNFVARHSRRGTEQRLHVVLAFVLVHPQNDRFAIRIKRLADQLSKERLSGAGWPHQQKSAEQLTGPGNRHFTRQAGNHGFDRFILSSHVHL